MTEKYTLSFQILDLAPNFTIGPYIAQVYTELVLLPHRMNSGDATLQHFLDLNDSEGLEKVLSTWLAMRAKAAGVVDQLTPAQQTYALGNPLGGLVTSAEQRESLATAVASTHGIDTAIQILPSVAEKYPASAGICRLVEEGVKAVSPDLAQCGAENTDVCDWVRE